MRKCIRCGSEMKEDCAVKVEGAGYGIILSSDEAKLFGGRIGKPKVAICPKCGEVSIYLEDVSKSFYLSGGCQQTGLDRSKCIPAYGGEVMAEPIVKTTALKKYYKTGSQLVKALDGVDFEVKEREFVAIIGKSGSGKTTLLHMLGGLDTPTSGSVTVGGTTLETLDNDRLAVFRRRKVGFIFQQCLR